MVKFLSSYTEKFKKLNRSVTPEGIAPHKPVLLLAVISTIAEGVITENVFPKQLLKSAFTRIWHALITPGIGLGSKIAATQRNLLEDDPENKGLQTQQGNIGFQALDSDTILPVHISVIVTVMAQTIRMQGSETASAVVVH